MFKMNCRIIVSILMFFAVVTTAKSEGAWDIEYLPAGDYESAIGVGFYRYEQEGFGFYGNFQMTLGDREPSYDSLNLSSFGDPVTNKYKDILLLNLGVTKKVNSYFSGYIGGGLASVTGVAQKYDSTRILSSNGSYYVNDSQNDETGLNINPGIIISLEKIIFNLGYHSFTGSTYFGIGGQF